MKNLKLLNAQHRAAGKGDTFCIDLDGTIYFGSKSISCMDTNSWNVNICTELTTNNENSKVHIIGMEFLFESNSIFVGSSSGDLYLYNIDDKELSCVGVVETGLEGFSWSPDQELLVLLTGASTLILMTKDFDALTEKSLCTEEFGENKPINVGWGSKTTQFHGSEGKGAAVVKQKQPKPALSYDDKHPRISWRKDGEYFVTSSIDESKGYRQLRVWSQEAVLQFTGEIVEGLEEPICWRPVGNVIACSQQCANKHKIIFFEKNGLQHGEFALPFQPNTFKVIDLSWNLDSSILLVTVEELVENPSEFHVMLWTSSNYHWYLKQRFHLQKSHPLKTLVTKWSAFQPYELYCYNQTSEEFYIFKWAWSILHDSQYNNCDDSIIASIDNESILISPFGKLVVPPPLCGYMYSMTSSVQSVFFAPDRPAFGAYLGDNKLAFFLKESNSDLPAKLIDECKLKLVAAGGNDFKSQINPYSYIGSLNIDLGDVPTASFGLCHWTWAKDNQLLFACYCVEGDLRFKYVILSMKLPTSWKENEGKKVPRILANFDSSIVSMCVNSKGTVVAIQLASGKVYQLNLDDVTGTVSPWNCSSGTPLIIPQSCSNMSIISVSGKDYILGLSEKYNLYCNDIILLPNCTSYFVTKEFLLATTVDHVLKCYTKQHDVAEAFKKNSTLPDNVQRQKIEKGARIVIAPSNSTKVILQMPRGNLETIHPRPLVLSSICEFLDHLQFGKAFELAKVHRIDLNVLYDHNPKKFLENINVVIDQISSPSDLNLFITSLKNEDVCLTMYPLIFEQKLHENTLLPNKINIICNAVSSALDEKNADRYHQTIMGIYAKKIPPKVDQALMRLKALKDSNDSKCTQDLVDGALNFLLYLIDVNELMDIALGTYDLGTTIMVAQKSQKDPKEFLPFYNELQKLEENYRKYKIDMHLKRFKKALHHISKCDDHFDECLALIKNQRLYVDALQLFPHLSDRYKVVWKEYGNYLIEKRYFDEAGLVFTRCEDYEKALFAYKESLNWQMGLCSAANLNYSDDQMLSLCQEMAKKLKSNQKYKDAAFLLEQYVKDIEESIVTLIEGCEWDMAMLMISKYRRNDIAETHLKPALKDHHTYLKSHLEQLHEDFNKHLERLKFLRTQKKKEAEQPSAMKYAEDDLFSDTGSVTDVASSCASTAESKQMSGSIMTKKSSKSRRKQKLKKYRLKEGSANEDLAHIVALSEIVTKVDMLKDNFLNTLRVLVQFGYDVATKEVQMKMTSLVELIQSEMGNIWNPVENSNPSPEMKFGPDSTVNSITASLQQENASTAPVQTDPELTAPPWRNVDLSLQMFK